MSQFGIIEKNTNQDWFRFTTGSGAINLTIQAITKAWINNGGSFSAEYLTQPSGATNLDIWAGIYGSDGTTLIAQSNPTDLLSANFSNLFLNAGTYYLAIDGVGKGDLITGYSDYGSLGQYAITGTIIGNGMTVTPIAGLTTTEEGGTATFTVVLNTAPTADVVITLNSSNTNEGTIDKSTLTFTTANWNIAQQVTVTGVDDAINDGDQNYSIILNSASSTDANYNGIDPRDVSLVNINNDLPVLNITTSPQVIVEGLTSPQSVVYTVELTGIINSSQTVTVQYATSNASATSGSDYTSTTGTLTFTGGVTSQNITIPIINNALNEADETFTLTLSNPTQATLGNTASVTTTITDTLVTDVTTTLANGVENLTLIGTNAINGTGNSSNNILIGNSSNNILNGSTGIDNLIGGIGDDIYVVDTTTDVITENAGEGTDTIQSSVTFALTALTNLENLTLTGSSVINGTGNAGNNTLTGNNANNILNGVEGIDILNGAGGIDTLIGGTGDDIYIVDTTTDIITENAGEGTDTIQSSVTFSLSALSNIENLTLTGTSAINGTGNAANNIITGNIGNNTLNGGDGIDTLIGGMGNDIYIVDTTTDGITENAGEGTDTIQSSVTFDLSALPNIENLTLTGTNALNGTGNAMNNIITGNMADNILTGGDGIDTLIGGTGNDSYVVDTTTDVITENAASGTDTIQSSVTFDLSILTNIENLTLIGTSAINGTGNAGNNALTGNNANNVLNGAAGIDILNGTDGIDTLIGGIGDDIYVVDTTTDVITENAGEGTDTIQSSVTFALTALTNLENLTLTGSSAINGTGNAGNNALTGNNANNILNGVEGIDILNGAGGIDTLIGGIGNDIYVVDTTTDVITENLGEGTDTIQSSIAFALTTLTNIENLTLTGSSAINGTGNAGNNALTGNNANNILNGVEGIDILNGAGGIDTLIGGIGDDIYVVDTTTDVITENLGEGTDTIQSSVTFALTALTNLENLTLTGSSAIDGTGNAGNNTLTGNNANNILNGVEGIDILNGAGGIDTLIGGIGDDIYVVDTTTDVITENAGEGTDTIQSSVTFALTALTNLENLTLTGSSVINGTGNAGNNTLTGNNANNILNGVEGIDILNGAGGIDTLIGGTGDDIYIVDTTTDIITENAGEGTDTIQSSVTFSLSALSNIENLTLTGTSAINGTGNAANNIITGNIGNNTLNGGDGIDTLIGGMGNDIYIVDTTTDGITENAGEGTDTIQSSVTFDLSALPNIENLTLTGTNALNGTGNAMNNIITGNTADNILTGGDGLDTLIGGTGNDSYVVDTTTDVITENAASGTDTIQSSVTFSIASLTNIENLTLTGSNAINGIGNTGNNTITGNIANNTFNGGSGIDTLIGSTGDDIYIVDTTTDIITENIGEGTDTIQSSVTFSLSALTNIENLALTGTSAINGTGNAANNIITGNIGNNTLNGGDGIDTLIGGMGNDIYILDTTTDGITENAGEGTDTIQSSVTFDLSALPNIENLTLTGTNALNGTGNAMNNIITGNTADNILTGGDGFDTLIGGTGNDSYVVDTTTDVITENAASGTDTIQSSVTFSIASLTNIENLTLTGSNAINGTGNAGNNTIMGNTVDNILTGGGGSDTLTGGLGFDRFSYTNLGDSLLGSTNNSFDVITDFNTDMGNDLFLVSTARSGFIDVGAIATLDATGIGAALTTTAFKANYAAQFTFTSGSTTRTFMSINNGTAGFSATADAIVEITGLTGTIGLGNFTII